MPDRFDHPAALAGPPIPWTALRRILVVRPDNLGDVLLTGPALAALSAAAPRARIDLLASPAGAAAAALLPEVDDTVVARVSWQRIVPEPGPPDEGLAGVLASRDYDAAVLLTSFSQSPWPAAYVCQQAGIPIRAGTSKEFGGAGLTHWVPAPDDGLHQVDRALHLLGRLGVPSRGTSLHARVDGSGPDVRRAVGLDPDRPYAVLLPGASCASRRYPAPRFRAVVSGLTGAGLQVAVSGPASESGLVAAAAGGIDGAVACAGGLDVPELAQLLAGAGVVVANNSGGMHLADAVGTPVTVLFAGTELVDQFRPRSVPAVVLGRPTTCSPCRQFTCPFSLECLDVAPEEVVAAALGLVRDRDPGHAAACRPDSGHRRTARLIEEFPCPRPCRSTPRRPRSC